MEKIKKMLVVVAIFAYAGLLGFEVACAEGTSNGSAPIITHSYAVEKGQYGNIWKIYIEANDQDGDMSEIAVVVHQLGYGHYPTDWIVVKPPFRKEMRGYIQWNTFSSKTSYLREWTNITLTVSVFDKTGKESNEVVFPFEFVSGAHRYPKPPAPFNGEGLPILGYIHIDLFEPTIDGRDAPREY